MASPCCKLVGNLDINLSGCIISVNMSSRAEIIKECDGQPLFGPSTGTISITGYAVNLNPNTSPFHVDCPGRAGVSIPWVRRYDCDTNTVYMIPAGQGSSYVAGEVNGLASINISANPRMTFTSYSASSSSGPATIYMETEQEDGYGLTYRGDPISFDTGDALIFQNFMTPGGPELYLQSFSLEMSPGEIPVANYSFMFVLN